MLTLRDLVQQFLVPFSLPVNQSRVTYRGRLLIVVWSGLECISYITSSAPFFFFFENVQRNLTVPLLRFGLSLCWKQLTSSLLTCPAYPLQSTAQSPVIFKCVFWWRSSVEECVSCCLPDPWMLAKHTEASSSHSVTAELQQARLHSFVQTVAADIVRNSGWWDSKKVIPIIWPNAQ